MSQKITQIQETINFVKSFHGNDASGHDWFHIQRVTNLAKKIGEKEGGDLFRIEITALLHDVADYKLNDGDENKGIQKIIYFLEKIEIDTSVIQFIISDIKNISFKGAEVGQNPLTKEGQMFTGASLDLPCGIGFCAEHSAIANMISHSNETQIKTIVAHNESEILYPCGRCRQLMELIDEKNRDNTEVIISKNKKVRLKELLPGKFV